MEDAERMGLPVPDLDGGAGSMNPMDRETRYKGREEKLLLKGAVHGG